MFQSESGLYQGLLAAFKVLRIGQETDTSDG